MEATHPTVASRNPAMDVTEWARALIARYAAIYGAATPRSSDSNEVLSGELGRWLKGHGVAAERLAHARAREAEVEAQRVRAAEWPDASRHRWSRLFFGVARTPLERDLLALLVGFDLSPQVSAAARLLSLWPEAAGVARGFVQAVLDPLQEQLAAVAQVLRSGHRLAVRGLIRGLEEDGSGRPRFLDVAPVLLTWLHEGPQVACERIGGLSYTAPDSPESERGEFLKLVTEAELAPLVECIAQGQRVRLRCSSSDDAMLIARLAARRMGAGLVTVDLSESHGENQLRGDVVRAAALLASLEGALLLLRGTDVGHADPALIGATLAANEVAVVVEEPAGEMSKALAAIFSGQVFEATFPDRGRRATIWTHVLPDAVRATIGDTGIQRLAAFPLSAAQILRVQALSPLERVGLGAFEDACRDHVGHRVGDVAHRVRSAARWEDVVLPESVLAVVREILAFARHGERVLGEWGFGARFHYGLGLSALFSGPPGTGKTMVAGLVARELGLDLFRVDLSRVVSKYIGETEQRLARLFDEAGRGGVALVFDEADSLFARRTEVKSSVDRYANLEVNFLLQRMEDFQGVVILTTNLVESVDEAFKRRIRFYANFPRPGEEERERLWATMLPRGAPVEDDLPLDALARAYEFSGGEIKNAVLRAAFYAAEADSPITLELLDRAAEAECKERGRLVLRTAATYLS